MSSTFLMTSRCTCLADPSMTCIEHPIKGQVMSDKDVSEIIATEAEHVVGTAQPLMHSIQVGQPKKVMVITTDNIVELYDAGGEIYLEITPDGFSFRGEKVSVGNAGIKFAEWVKQMCNITEASDE